MTGSIWLRALQLLLLVFTIKLAGAAETVAAQAIPPPAQCLADAKFVKVLGLWQGQPVCEITGTGTGEFQGSPGSRGPVTSNDCLVNYQIVTFGNYRYCLWKSQQIFLATIIYDPGSAPVAPDTVSIFFPTPNKSSEAVSAQGAFTDNGHCTFDPRFVGKLGKWRNVTLCHWSGSGVLDPLPETSCGGGSYPNGQILIFPNDFANPPAPTSANPVGTRYCVSFAYAWDQLGTRAALMAKQSSTRVCVIKYVDSKLNHVRDLGEPTSQGVSFKLARTVAGVTTSLGSGVTDATGRFCWGVPSAGDYTVEEQVPAGWANTDPGGQAPFKKTVTVQANQWAWAVFGNAQAFDLGVDTHFARPLPPSGNAANLSVWISSATSIPAGRELVVDLSLTTPGSFTAWTVQTPGWACSGSWANLSCRKTLSAPLNAPVVLVLRTTYPTGFSGQSLIYAAKATMTDNVDPILSNNKMTVQTTRY